MQIGSIRPEDMASWEKLHGSLLSFFREYGGTRHTPGAYKWLMRLTPLFLQQPGNHIVLATLRTEDGCRLAGYSFAANYGSDLSCVVVHPLYRSKGIGTRLLRKQLAELGHMELHVPINHVAALKMCFKAGFTADRVSTELSSRPTLLLKCRFSNTESASNGAPVNYV